MPEDTDARTGECSHPPQRLRTGVVAPADGLWSRDPLDHVWIACTACGAVVRVAPVAEAYEAEAGAPSPYSQRGSA